MSTCVLTFQDPYGNPLPPRTQVFLHNATDAPGTAPLDGGFIGVGSSWTTTALTIGDTYRVEYAGAAAPSIQTFFEAEAAVTITPDQYISPWANLAGYAGGPDYGLGDWMPKDRMAHSALLPGGQFRVMLETAASALAQLDLFNRQVSAGERLLSSTANQITSWVADFLGSVLPPNPGETDAHYITRIEDWIQQAFTTIDSIQGVVTAFFEDQPDPSTSQLVFDVVTDPIRSAYYGIVKGYVAIALYYANGDWQDQWYLGQSFLGQNTRVSGTGNYTKSQTAPYPLLQQQVQAVKAGGIIPIYIVTSGDPVDLGEWGAPWGTPWGISSA